MNVNFKIILSFILIFTILFNFIYVEKVKAEALTLSFGAYIFLKALMATGVTVLGGIAISEILKEGKETLDNYKDDFYNWLDSLPEHDPNKLPEQDPNWAKNGIKFLLGAVGGFSFTKIVKSVKAWLKNKNYQVGTNIEDESFIVDFDYLQNINEVDIFPSGTIRTKYIYYDPTERTGILKTIFIKKDNKYYPIDISLEYGSWWIMGEYNSSHSNYNKLLFNGNYWQDYSNYNTWNGKLVLRKVNGDSNKVNFYMYGENGFSSKSINVNIDIDNVDLDLKSTHIEENSYFDTDNENDIKKLYPNLDSLPSNKVDNIYNTDGSVDKIYKGDIEDLINDIVNNVDVDNPFKTDTDINIEERPEGDIILEDSPNIYDDFEIPSDIDLDFSPLIISISDKFPFSLPWDIQRLFQSLKGDSKPPKWDIPIASETLTLDFEFFESWAIISRSFMILIVVFGLILITRGMIGG